MLRLIEYYSCGHSGPLHTFVPVSGGLLVQGSPNADSDTIYVRIILKEYIIKHSFGVPSPGDSDSTCLYFYECFTGI